MFNANTKAYIDIDVHKYIYITDAKIFFIKYM